MTLTRLHVFSTKQLKYQSIFISQLRWQTQERKFKSAGGTPARTPAADRRLDPENRETMEPLSPVLHADPHVSIRGSLKRGEDTPPPSPLSHRRGRSFPFVSLLRQRLPQIDRRPFCFVPHKKRGDREIPSADICHPSCRLETMI